MGLFVFARPLMTLVLDVEFTKQNDPLCARRRFPYNREVIRIVKSEVFLAKFDRSSFNKKGPGPTVSALLRQKTSTQSQLAQSVGMSAPQLSNFLNGKSDIHASTFIALLDHLGIDVLKLIRVEAGLTEASMTQVQSQLELLPSIEKDTLVQFLSAFRKRSLIDQERSKEEDSKIA